MTQRSIQQKLAGYLCRSSCLIFRCIGSILYKSCLGKSNRCARRVLGAAFPNKICNHNVIGGCISCCTLFKLGHLGHEA